ncbi:hypothetical protein HKX48_009322 [Thoreauomyces humboldtii]|nr:hypothetical protein HKX48_009322 [Thoreauomyces humboldtii]
MPWPRSRTTIGGSTFHPRYSPSRNADYTYVHALLEALRYRNTIIPKVFPVMLALSLWASLIVVLHKHLGYTLIVMDDKLIAILGGSLAMLLAFRSNRGFERYWQGATLWTSLTTQIRNLSRLIWNGVSSPDETARLERSQMMKMLLGVAVATKYALRGENALDQEELRRLLPTGYERESYRASLVDLDEMVMGLDASPPPPPLLSESVTSSAPCTPRGSTATRTTRRRKKIPPLILLRNRSLLVPVSPHSILTPTAASAPGPRGDINSGMVMNVPLDIIFRISAYLKRQRKVQRVDPEDNPSITSAVSAMIDAVSKFEQILYVPMPNSYDVHMKQVRRTRLKIRTSRGNLVLRNELVRQMGWTVVPVTVIASLAYFGVDAIAGEIEEPFGTDENDLPIDYFLLKLRGDIEYIMECGLDISEDDETEGVMGDMDDAASSPGSSTQDLRVDGITGEQERNKEKDV